MTSPAALDGEALLAELREWQATGRRYLLDQLAARLLRVVHYAVVRGALRGRRDAEDAAADAMASIWATVARRGCPEFEDASGMLAYFSTVARARARGAMARERGAFEVRPEHMQGMRAARFHSRYGDQKVVEDRIFLSDLPHAVVERLRTARGDWGGRRLAAAAYVVRRLFQRRPLSLHTLRELYGIRTPEEVALVKAVATVRTRHALRAIRHGLEDSVLGCKSGVVPEIPR